MKKSTMILSALLLGSAAFTAQAQTVYVSGSFNDYVEAEFGDAESVAEWTLTPYEDADGMFKGTFDIPAADEVIFNLRSLMGTYYVPSLGLDGNGYYGPAEENVPVSFDDDMYYGYVASTFFPAADLATYWVISNWEGGELEIVADLDNGEFILTKVGEEQVVGGPFYLVGSFNEYTNSLEDWQLSADPENPEIFRGTYTFPEGNVRFNISGPRATFVPGMVAEEGASVEPAAGNEDVVLTDGFWSGALAQTETEQEIGYWLVENWAGGELEIIADFENDEIIISVPQEETESEVLLLLGNFNEYEATGDIWELNPTDAEGVFRGTFNIAEGNLIFYISRPYRNMVVVPGVLDPNEEVGPAEDDVTVTLEDGSATGYAALTSLSNSKWVLDWTGGNLEITVDLNESTIVFDTVSTEEPPVVGSELYLAGNFNDYDPDGMEIWSLNVTDDPETYSGTFNLEAGNLSFYFVRNGGMQMVVPAVVVEGEAEPLGEDYTITLDEGFAAVPAVQTAGNDVYNVWNLAWEGGALEIKVDYANNLLILSAVPEEPIVGEPLYISGNFNDNDPSDLEIWALTSIEGTDSYRGTFTIEAADQLSFNFVRNAGTMVVVPAVVVEGEAEPADADVAVTWSEYDDFDGDAVLVDNLGNANVWTIANWEGGDLEVTVNLEENTIIIAKVNEDVEVATELYIAGDFNDWNPVGIETWTLGTTGTPYEYKGTFQIKKEGQISFNIFNQSYGMKYVPGAEIDGDIEPVEGQDVEVEDGYNGYLAIAPLGGVNWTVSNWGYNATLIVTVNLEEGTIVVAIDNSTVTGVDSINSANLENATIYNLQGVRVDSNKLNNGLYIINGKKVLVK